MRMQRKCFNRAQSKTDCRAREIIIDSEESEKGMKSCCARRGIIIDSEESRRERVIVLRDTLSKLKKKC